MNNSTSSSAHDLIPVKMLPVLPSFGQTSDERDPMARIRLFDAGGSWTWYIIEYDPKDHVCYGWVCGIEQEFGTFSLSELISLRGPLGLRVERDLHFEPCPISKLPKHERPSYFE